ncbi:MAG: response regulator, partial [Lachnospiraceae bacterium]|nr:response regulator [Lachnospiraceae bacterium]
MRRVMLVEDEDLILQGIRCIIDWEELSMTVVSMVHNGKEALEQFRENPVDIIVTDVEMPQMNGLELLEEIRKISPETRCIILSGYEEFAYARAALKLDVEEYILKPINEEQLRQA